MIRKSADALFFLLSIAFYVKLFPHRNVVIILKSASIAYQFFFVAAYQILVLIDGVYFLYLR
ncbi:hypothetical protein C7R94_09870 [Brevibacillus sp. NRRL NRS-603]|nr:hypothetical protein [Brevibacillus formosus]PSK19076.1 hypothetical protein C7R94_09870 [Brevibacillus sp. NRRL NRS-603]